MTCAFSEERFNRFLEEDGSKEDLLVSWSCRPVVGSLPQLKRLTTWVVDALCAAGEEILPRSSEVLDEIVESL